MKRVLLGIFLLLLTACSAAQSTVSDMPMDSTPTYPDLGPAPELTNETWLNVDAPLRIANLRGSVVALDMWTFG